MSVASKILRKTTILEQTTTFTTEPKRYIKRGCRTVRDRCIQFAEELARRGYRKMSVEQAKNEFSLTIGPWDQKTLKAYFGTLPARTERRIHRRAQYQTGTVSQKMITLSQDIKKTTGYLESLSLVHYEKQVGTWFLVLESPVLVPQLERHSEACVDEPSVSNDNFSLSPIPLEASSGGGVKDSIAGSCMVLLGTDGEAVENNDIETRGRDNKHTQHRVRERNRSSESDRLQSPELCTEAYDEHTEADLEPVFAAKPCFEADKATVRWSG